MKNLILSIVAVMLACFLAFLLFIATNQQALVKVHETISNFSTFDNVAKGKTLINTDENHSAKAAITGDKAEEKPYNAKDYVPIAEESSHDASNKKVAQANLPSFNVALKAAQEKVNNNNNSQNEYNDYAIDNTCQGAYYYIFTFKNVKKPHSFYRVTVDKHENAVIFDDAYKPVPQDEARKPNVSAQESEVIAQKYATDHFTQIPRLEKVKEAKQGMLYVFVDVQTKKELKLVITKSGKIITQPALK
ncbi:hypothetical protein [Staphylococcus arlettae]|uniref:hypothetical protein n=1 Tax=Staphylococcus arlettae TaxID=29378 RepID=UPI001E5CFD33|nr:hypothetical protein [Staphylococcus arlettae]MCD8848920.1 hypothetical protein [Staphylococcus arlettae]